MKYWEKRAWKNIKWDTYWIMNNILSKELLEKELERLKKIQCLSNSARWQTHIWKISIVEKELLKFN